MYLAVCTCVLGNLTRHSSLCTSRGKISAFRSVLQINRSASTMSHNRRYFCYCLGKNKGKRRRSDKLCACVSETILYFLYLTVWKTESDSSYQTWQQCVHVLSLIITQFSGRDAGMRHEQERHGSSKNQL